MSPALIKRGKNNLFVDELSPLIEFLYRHICKHKTSYFSQYYSHQSLEIRNMVY